MKINRDAFLDALDVSLKAVSKNAAIEEMLNFNFTNNQIITYNGPLFLNVPFDLNGLAFSIPAIKFKKTIMTMPDEFILEQTKMSVVLKGTKGKIKKYFGLTSYIEHNDLIDLAIQNKRKLKNIEWQNLPEEFIKGIKLCMFSGAKKNNLGTLSCLQIKGKYITSSDNSRISSFRMKKELDDFLLPIENCKTIIDLYPVFYYFSKEDNLLHFKTEDEIILTVRTITGKYPDYTSIAFTNYKKYEDFIFPTEVLTMVNNVGIINQDLSETEQLVNLKIKDNLLTVSTTSVAGWGRQIIELDKQIKNNFETTMSLLSFVEIIKYTSQVQIIKEMNRIVFISDQFRHVIPTKQ